MNQKFAFPFREIVPRGTIFGVDAGGQFGEVPFFRVLFFSLLPAIFSIFNFILSVFYD